ncbi:MAG: DUF417 family protein [Chitinophagaceae bacterium]|nr:DUF417 family protein [Chitinophagaceae bacterium]
MQKTHSTALADRLRKISYAISLSGTALLLLWIGITKFTPTEAQNIGPLIANSFLLSWMYEFFSLQTTAMILGSTEIAIAAGLIVSFRSPRLGIIAASLGIITFAITLSFLFTTPGLWRLMDGVPVTDFFILKDITVIGVCLGILGKNIARLHLAEKQADTV